MTSPREGLLAAIREDPDDDLSRLVLADWLEESAGTRKSGRDALAWATSIRAQVEAARCPRTDPRYWALQVSADAKRPEMSGALVPKAARAFIVDERGLPGLAKMAARTFLKVAPALADSPAPLHRLELAQCGALLGAVLERPELARFRSLTIEPAGQGDEGAERLATCPHLAGLTSLSVPRWGLTSVGIRQLARSPYLTGLRALDLSGNSTRAREFIELVESGTASNLRRLNCPLVIDSPEEIDAAIQAFCRCGLEKLRVDEFVTGYRWLQAMIDDLMPGLRTLVADFLPLPMPQAAFVRSRCFGSLTRLVMHSGSQFGDVWGGLREGDWPSGLDFEYRAPNESVAAFVRSPALGRCSALRLVCPTIYPDDYRALFLSPHARSLRVLACQDNWERSVSAATVHEIVRALLDSPHLGELHDLELNLPLRDADFIALAESGLAGRLTRLVLRNATISHRPLYERLWPGRFPELRKLVIVARTESYHVHEVLGHRFGEKNVSRY